MFKNLQKKYSGKRCLLQEKNRKILKHQIEILGLRKYNI